MLKRLLAVAALPLALACGGPDLSTLDLPAEPEAQVKYGLELHADGRYFEAASVFNVASTALPVAISYEARSILETGDTETALVRARDAVAHPELAASPLAPFVRGLAAERAEQPEEAEGAYRAALDLAPGWASAMNNLAGLHYDRGELPAARDLFFKALRHSCGNASTRSIVLANLSELDLIDGDLHRAAWIAAKAVQQAPEEAGAHFWQAVVRDLQGDYHGALASARRGLELDPHGATRRSIKWLHPEQATHFQALLAEADGLASTARVLFTRLEAQERSGELTVGALAGRASAHLAKLGSAAARGGSHGQSRCRGG